MTASCDLDRAVSADEIGIETARHGGLVLRSAFQLVFRREAGVLRAVAAEGFLRPFDKGMPMAPRPFFASLGADERAAVERLAAALHLANHRHVDAEGLDVVLGVGKAAGFADNLAALMERADMPPSRLVCTFRDPACFSPDALRDIAGVLKAFGARVAIGGLAGGQPPLETVRRIAPDIVRIDGFWFRRVAESESALRLLRQLVEGFRAEGALVLIEGIETRRQLAAALDAGADLYQGFLLSHPLLAGTAIDSVSIELAHMFAGEAKVIPLFGARG